MLLAWAYSRLGYYYWTKIITNNFEELQEGITNTGISNAFFFIISSC